MAHGFVAFKLTDEPDIIGAVVVVGECHASSVHGGSSPLVVAVCHGEVGSVSRQPSSQAQSRVKRAEVCSDRAAATDAYALTVCVQDTAPVADPVVATRRVHADADRV